MSKNKKYYYKDRSEVKENDIVFYSEDKGNGEYHYADSIGLIVRIDNELFHETIIYTSDDAKTFNKLEDSKFSLNSLHWHQNLQKDDGIMLDMVKIGEYPKDNSMLTVEYANDIYSTKRKYKKRIKVS